jgi:ATP-binding cassette subfamily B protein
MVIANLVDAGTPLLASHLNERLKLTLERRLYEKALSLDLAAFERPDYYDRLERARASLGGRLVTSLGVARQFLSDLIAAVGIVFVLARVSWPLALLLLVGSLPVALLGVWESQEFHRIHYRQSPLKRKLAYWRDLSTRREPAAELRLFGLGDTFLQRWRQLQEQLFEELFAARRRMTRGSLALIGSANLLGGIVIAGVIAARVAGTITAGALVAVLYALRQFESLRGNFAWQLETLHRLFYTDFPALVEFMNPDDGTGATSTPPPWLPLPAGDRRTSGRSVRFEKVTFTYPGSSEPALCQIDLEIRPGERLAVVGENGAGKSTLARLLLGLYEPSAGRVLVAGVDLREIDPSAWRAQAAAVFQSFVRYQLTARENIGFGEPRFLQEQERLVTAARKSGAHAVVQPLRSGYETLLGKGFSGAEELSVGQWQKLALARAYLRDAQVLVLDEPAASLDALAETMVYRQFGEVSEGKTMLLISHRLGSARLADRIVFLERGRIVQVGSHEELIARGGPYAELYALQAEWYREPGADGESTADNESA